MNINNQFDSLSDMAVFARVVDAGSFSGAARQLSLTPSAVSRQIARLEGVLRVQLLVRSTRKLSLTEAGSAAYLRCQDMLAAAREVWALAFGRVVVHPLMPRFLQQYPEVDVQLVITDRTVDLFEEAIDLAIRVTQTPPPGLAGRPLMRIRHVVCASPGYLADHGTPTHPRDLSQHSCIYLGENELDCHWRFCRDGEELTVKVSGRYVANHSEVRLEGALQSLGIASLPEFTARASLASGELVSVLDDWEHATHYAGMAWLLYPPNRFLAAKLRVWIDHVVAGLASEECEKPHESGKVHLRNA